jgi:hypothetical protein
MSALRDEALVYPPGAEDDDAWLRRPSASIREIVPASEPLEGVLVNAFSESFFCRIIKA